ncbi:MAG TPA: histidine phosphatase family protein [Planktothrix sp.]|jgi:probable phosphoglycerate mutase
MPKPSNIYVLRHGETEWSLSGQHTGRTDIPLTETGKKQAIELGESLKNIRFSAVFVSPLGRARETAALAGLINATICDDLAEVNYGQYEGLTSTQIQERVPGWTVWTHPLPGGETLAQVAKRAKNVLDLASTYDGNVALVSHGHFSRIIATVWLGFPPEAGKHLMLDTACFSILSFEHDNPAIKLWNSQPHP